MARILLFVAVLLLFGAHAALAAENPELAKCAAITSDAERLACFDALAKKLGVAAPAQQTTTGVGKWTVRKDTSPIDDKTNVYVTLDAEKEISGWPQKSYLPTLFLRCKEGKTEAYITTGMAPGVEGSGDGCTVRLRFDKERVSPAYMSKSSDNEALFFPDAVKRIKQIMQHETLLFEFTPFNSSPTMTSFDLRGLTEALKPLRETCHW